VSKQNYFSRSLTLKYENIFELTHHRHCCDVVKHTCGWNRGKSL